MTSILPGRIRMRTSILRLAFRLSFTLALVASLLSSTPSWATSPDVDFGLPLFGGDEIRLERTKAPEFNLHLVKKYLGETNDRPLHRLHAIAHLGNLLKLSDEDKARELRTRARAMFRPSSLANASGSELLLHLFLEGLLLAHLDDAAAKPGNTPPAGDLNKPDKEFEKILFACEEKLSDKPEYHLVKGILFILLRGRPNGFFAPMRPLEDLKRAAVLAPKEPHFQFALGQAFRLLGTDENTLFFAILCYEKAGALAPGNQRLHHTLLSLYMSLHESYQGQRRKEPFWLEEAVYRKILTLSPNNPHAQNNLGYLYAEHGVHREQAQQLCQAAVDQMPNNPGFHDSLGWAAFKNGKYEKAEKELLTAIKMMPESYDAHYHLGTLYYVTKRFDKAVTMYEKAVTFQPTSAEALNNYAYLLAENDRDLDKAHDMALRATRLEPENASYIDTLGWIEFKRGNHREALRLLKKAVNIAPDVGEILAHAGRVNLELKEFDAAISFLNQAHKADPTLSDLQHDLYLAISLKAIHRAIADYHRLFGARASSEHLMGFLLQLARLYQEEGQFSSAIAANQLCEKLKRNEIDLSQPLFDFYTIDIATPTPTIAASGGELSPIVDYEETELATISPSLEASAASAPTVFPPAYRACLGLHFGPAFFRILGHHLNLDPEFANLSVSIFLPSLERPMQHLRLRFALPELSRRKALGVLGNYLALFGCAIDEATPPIPGYPGFSTRFARHPLWAFQTGNQLITGLGEPITMDEIASLAVTFPDDPDAMMGFLIDWPTIEEQLPPWVQTIVGNPLHPYFRVLGQYRRDGVILRETALLEPVCKIDRGFMQRLAGDLFAYKTMLMKIGMKVAIRVEANDGCIRLSTDYGEIPRLLRGLVRRVSWLEPLFRSRLQSWHCLFRRSTCPGSPDSRKNCCPTGGAVALSGDTGLFHCSKHRDQGAFPLPIRTPDRCRLSRERLESLLKRFFPKTPISPENEGLLEKLRMDYNVPSCPAGGVLSRDAAGRVNCPLHAD